MTDTDALNESIARALYENAEYYGPEDTQPAWEHRDDEERDEWREIAAAVLPIVAEEVRKAKAEVWVEAIRYSIDCGNETTDSCGNMYRLDWIDRMEREIEQNPYAPETGDSNEHR